MTNNKKLNMLSVAAFSIIIIVSLVQCKESDDTPAPSSSSNNSGSSISNNTTPPDTSSVVSSYGSLSFQGAMYTIKGGCYTTNGSYDVRGTSSSYDLTVQFPNGKPTSNTTINFPSSEIEITESKASSNIWTPVSGSAAVSVNQQGAVTISFKDA